MATNPRYKNGALRRKHRQRFKAMGLPCAICKGRLGEIDYSNSDPKNPRGFVIDEIIPVSKWREAGYASAEACANDFNNLQPAHRWCNSQKGNKLNYSLAQQGGHQKKNIKENNNKPIKLDGDW